MTLETKSTDDMLALLVVTRDDCAEAAQFLRNVGTVYASRQAARLEQSAIRLDVVVGNLRMGRRDADA